MKVVGEPQTDGGPIWWAATADNHVYPQEMSVPPLSGIAASTADNQIDPAKVKGVTTYFRAVYGSFAGWTIPMFADTLIASQAEERRISGGGPSQLPTPDGRMTVKSKLPDGEAWSVLKSTGPLRCRRRTLAMHYV